MNVAQLKEIIKDLQLVIKETNLSISQEIIFENACQYHRGQLASKSKEKKQESDPITEGQDIFLRKNEAELRLLGFDLDSIQNKSDAFEVIAAYKKLKEENNEKRRKSNPDY
jgi:hypothetical protein